MLSHLISSEIVAAFHHCERKAFLMLRGDQGDREASYSAMMDEALERCKISLEANIQMKYPGALPYSLEVLKSGSKATFEAYLENETLFGTADALVPVRSSSGKHATKLEAIIASPHHVVVSHDKIRLGVVSGILAGKQGVFPQAGYIFTPEGIFHQVRLQAIYPQIRRTVGTISKWLGNVITDEPEVILNKHCSECPFQVSCKNAGIRDDSLTLLSGMSPKKLAQYHKKGIFTVTQLSYQFRPRKGRSLAPKKPIHRPELQALAIRTKLTYIVQIPDLNRSDNEIFLDFEGVPELNFYYLAGLVVMTRKGVVSFSFWADTPNDESKLWRNVLDVVQLYPEAPIFHYGHYESKAFHTLSERHGCEIPDLAKRLVNVVSIIYGKVYFPVYQNGLKELGGHLGVEWLKPLDSGLKALVWRQRWEWLHDTEIKRQLIQYNQQDCNALKAVVDRITTVIRIVDTDSFVDFADCPKKHATPTGDDVHKEFDALLLLGHSRYSEKRIAFTKRAIDESDSGIAPVQRKQRDAPPKPTKSVNVAPRRKCPKCKSSNIAIRKKMARALVVDFVFTGSGCRRTITEFIGPMIECRKCGSLSIPVRIQEHRGERYGHRLVSYIAYQRMVLRLSLRTISSSLGEIFGLNMPARTIDVLLSETAAEHVTTESRIKAQILGSPFVHCDETQVNIEGKNHYVWVLTDGKHVIFKSTPTRETDWVKSILAGYSGILVTDFYAGYDSLACRQQKCLSHFIRDLNDDLWKEPFNHEFEMFADNFKLLIVPIMETVQRYGSKKRNLSKHAKEVALFYRKCIDGVEYSHETTRKYQKRFERYRDSMFTFLTEDWIPWNNNMAERALRHLAIQRKISGSFGKEGIHRYLRLLGVAQTCRFQEKSFLRFLLSEGKDVDAFCGSKRRR